MVSVSFEKGIATVSVTSDANDADTALRLALVSIRDAIDSGSRSDLQIQAEATARADMLIAAKAVVTVIAL